MTMSDPSLLTGREQCVLLRLAYGHTQVRIAGDLHMTPANVGGVVTEIRAKLRVATTSQAVDIAVRAGYIDPLAWVS